MSKNKIQVLINKVEKTELSKSDIGRAKEYYAVGEYLLSYEQIVTQLYEYSIKMDRELYLLIEEIGKELNLEASNYEFLKENIR